MYSMHFNESYTELYDRSEGGTLMLAVHGGAKDSSGNSGGGEGRFKGWVWNFKSVSLFQDMLWFNPVLWFE